MASIKLSHLYKVYPNGVKAVNDFTMDIDDKEFIVFVGPSGCGKSTTLRMIAGLEEISAGEIRIGDEIVNDVEPKDRDIAMVFQNYALYPHMTVYENMAFGLKMRKTPKDEIDRRVNEAAEILGITEYLKRKPAAMSGGQRQRVALGRAIVREPKVFLLDEPLSNLDAKLRTVMRSEIAKLHQRIKTTFIYVTHDQVEAMTMGTRIVVMKDGFVQQIDTPRNLYDYPCNKFVAGFIGTPQMNFFSGRLKRNGAKVRMTIDGTDAEIDAPYAYFSKADPSYLDGEKQIIIGLRSEDISIDGKKFPYRAKCKISHTEDLGVDCQIYADFNINGDDDSLSESGTRIIVKAPAGYTCGYGDIAEVSLNLKKVHLFDAETENTIAPRIPEEQIFSGEVKDGVITILGAKFKLPPAICLNDGIYSLRVPVSALSFGGDIKAAYVSEEDVFGKRLVCVKAGGNLYYIKARDGADVNGGISIDFKRCTFGSGEDIVVAAIPEENVLPAKIVSYKQAVTREVKGKEKKVKEKKYRLVTGEDEIDYPDNRGRRIVNGGGKAVFKDELEIRFTPDAVKISETGITAQIADFADYGTEKIAVCQVGGSRVFVLVDGETEKKEVRLSLDTERLTVYDKTIEIRLV